MSWWYPGSGGGRGGNNNNNNNNNNNGDSSSDSSSCPDACSSFFSRLNEYCSGDPCNYGNWYLKDESDSSLVYVGATSSGYSSGTVYTASNGDEYTLVTCGCETNTTAVIGLAAGGAALVIILISVAVYLFVSCRQRSVRRKRRVGDGAQTPSTDMVGIDVESAASQTTTAAVFALPANSYPSHDRLGARLHPSVAPVAGIPMDSLGQQLGPAAGQVIVAGTRGEASSRRTTNAFDVSEEMSQIPSYARERGPDAFGYGDADDGVVETRDGIYYSPLVGVDLTTSYSRAGEPPAFAEPPMSIPPHRPIHANEPSYDAGDDVDRHDVSAPTINNLHTPSMLRSSEVATARLAVRNGRTVAATRSSTTAVFLPQSAREEAAAAITSHE